MPSAGGPRSRTWVMPRSDITRRISRKLKCSKTQATHLTTYQSPMIRLVGWRKRWEPSRPSILTKRRRMKSWLPRRPCAKTTLIWYHVCTKPYRSAAETNRASCLTLIRIPSWIGWASVKNSGATFASQEPKLQSVLVSDEDEEVDIESTLGF